MTSPQSLEIELHWCNIRGATLIVAKEQNRRLALLLLSLGRSGDVHYLLDKTKHQLHPDFISQPWRKIGRRPGIITKWWTRLVQTESMLCTNRVHHFQSMT